MSSLNSDDDFDKLKEEANNEESEKQFPDSEPIKDSPWAGESVIEESLDEDHRTAGDLPDETFSKGTPSWVSTPDEKSVENVNINPDLDEMKEIHELDELDRLDELDGVESLEEEDADSKVEGIFAPAVSLSPLVGPLTTLLNQEETEQYRTRWNKIQGNFVDDPKTTVQEADILLSELIEEMKKKFTDELSALESQWMQGSRVTTEDLRITLQLYRSFFNRMVGKN